VPAAGINLLSGVPLGRCPDEVVLRLLRTNSVQYQPFDIVMLRPESGARIYAIVEVMPDRPASPYIAVRLDRGALTRRYRLNDDQILAKIGTLDPEALKLDPARVEITPSVDWQLGQHFAPYMAERAATEPDRQRWALLASLKPGDPIAIRRYSSGVERIEQHRFREVLPSGQKYHFAAVNANGTVYRWPLAVVHLGGTGGSSALLASENKP
jgi:hypothetical protein